MTGGGAVESRRATAAATRLQASTEAVSDIGAEVAALTAALRQRADPTYERGMRRTVPSQQPAHAVRVPEIRRLAAAWSREHRAVPAETLLALAEALWQTGWREERILAVAVVARSAGARSLLNWETIERWSETIDNWELVDNLAGLVSGPLLVGRPALIAEIERLASTAHVWQRRLAVVTLIEAAREDGTWLQTLRSMTDRLRGDRGPTMRKALDWARRTAEKLEARNA